MGDDSSLITYLRTLKDQEATGSRVEVAANELYRRYIDQVIQLARQRLPRSRRRVADEEDVAQAALASFFRCAREGRFRDLDDAHDLWQVLVMLTEKKAIDQLRRQTAQKRGAGNVRGDSVFERVDGTSSRVEGIDGQAVVGPIGRCEPTPEFAVMVAEEFQQRIRQLQAIDRTDFQGKKLLVEIALRRFEGESVSEIAQHFRRTSRTIERRIELIRRIWESQATRDEQ